jgi:hypothetical protein
MKPELQIGRSPKKRAWISNCPEHSREEKNRKYCGRRRDKEKLRCGARTKT